MPARRPRIVSEASERLGRTLMARRGGNAAQGHREGLACGCVDIAQVPVAEVVEHPANARRGDVEAIKLSLETHGQYAPVVVQRSTGYVVKGNHTLRAARELGWDTIGVVYVDVNDDQATRIMLVDNATSDAGTYDAQSMQDLIDALEGDLAGTGYDAESIDELLRTLGGELPTVEHVPVDSVRPHSRNYQTHPPAQVEQIAQSIREHGFYRSVVVADDGTILAGHGVVEAARLLDLPLLPVIRLPIRSDDPRALRVMAGDNELNNMAEVDDRALTELLRELYGEGGDAALLGTGFDAEQLAAMAMVTRHSGEIREDDAGEWVGMGDYTPSKRIPIVNIQFDSFEERAAWCDEHLPGFTIRAAGGLGPADARGWDDVGGYSLRKDSGGGWSVLDGERLVGQFPHKVEAIDWARRQQAKVWATSFPDRPATDRQSVEWQSSAEAVS